MRFSGGNHGAGGWIWGHAITALTQEIGVGCDQDHDDDGSGINGGIHDGGYGCWGGMPFNLGYGGGGRGHDNFGNFGPGSNLSRAMAGCGATEKNLGVMVKIDNTAMVASPLACISS